MTRAPRWLVWTRDREIDGKPAYLLFSPATLGDVRSRRTRAIGTGVGVALALAVVVTLVACLAAGLTAGLIAAAITVVVATDSTYGRETVRITWNPVLADLDLARRRAPHLLAELHPLAWDVLAHSRHTSAIDLRAARKRLHREVARQGPGVVDALMRAA